MPIATPKPDLFALIGCEGGFCFTAELLLVLLQDLEGCLLR
jgi:hypothetical protein